jgi:serine/threonine-protein kinase
MAVVYKAHVSGMPDTPASQPARLLLIGLAAAMASLAVYQWAELFTLARGEHLTCSISETVDCAVVWKSEFAQRARSLTGLPVAGLGVAWGLPAMLLAIFLARRTRRGVETHVLQAAVRAWGTLGALFCITLGVASYRTGAVCITCLGTYVLVVAYAAVAFFMLPDAPEVSVARARSAVGTILLTFAPVYLLLLVPATQTPTGNEGTKLASDPAQSPAVAFEKLRPEEKEFMAIALAAYKQSPVPDTTRYPVRQLKGPADAPVHIVDFTDILCPHCAALVKQMEELEKVVPPGSISVEARQFPLDGECNKLIQAKRGDGVRCTAAKAMVCLEGTPDFWTLRSKLFAAQNQLTTDLVLEIASQGSMKREQLLQCIGAAATETKLEFDQNYAMEFKPEGTPLVIVNGHATAPSPWFLYGMALAKGDINAPWFTALPTPRMRGE